MALVELDRELSGYDARIVHILHDEIIVEVKEDIADGLVVAVKIVWRGRSLKYFRRYLLW